MEVKTYEVATCDVRLDDEAIALANELGLEGQAGLADECNSGKPPYKKLGPEEVNAIKYLFTAVGIEKFSACPMPVEVLKSVAFVRERWSDSVLQVLDRGSGLNQWVVTARLGTGTYPPPDYFLLAAWGAPLSFPSLIREAKMQTHAEKLSRLRGFAVRSKSLVAELEGMDELSIIASTKIGSLPAFYE